MEHNWSGWPGAWCLNCGQEDRAEAAMADGVDPDTDPWPQQYTNGTCPGPKDAHNPYVILPPIPPPPPPHPDIRVENKEKVV